MRRFEEGDRVRLLEPTMGQDDAGRRCRLAGGAEGTVIVANAAGYQVVEFVVVKVLPDGSYAANRYVEADLADDQVELVRAA